MSPGLTGIGTFGEEWPLTRVLRLASCAAESCGSNSVVECNLAKVDVEGSSPLLPLPESLDRLAVRGRGQAVPSRSATTATSGEARLAVPTARRRPRRELRLQRNCPPERIPLNPQVFSVTSTRLASRLRAWSWSAARKQGT